MTARPLLSALLALILVGCSSSGSNGTPDGGNTGGGAGVVTGIVTDIGTGAWVSGATVSGGGKTATTDTQGGFSLTGLAAGSVEVSISKTGYAPGFANATAGTGSDSVFVRLKAQGAPQSYNATTTQTLSQTTENGPYAVILQPNSLDTSDANITVSITPLDPTTEAAALPGSLVAGGTTSSLLLPVTFAEFTLRDSAGNRVNLKSSANAQVELPIPAALRSSYPLSTKIHCYSYDSTTGKWEDFVDGTVQTSSVDGTTPVLAASIRHFSWYGGAPEGNNCVDVYVKVTSAVDGKPLGNARVEATPGTVGYTDASGSALIRSAVGTTGSTFTAYQTGIDVDGSLTGMAGAKYIEFGQVEEDLVGLVTKPCSSAISGPSSGTGSTGSPFPISIGVVKNLLYSATAVLSASGGSGEVFVILEQGVPGPDGTLTNPLPADDAKIYIAEAGGPPTPLTLVSPGSGTYYNTSAITVTAGKAYTLTIDGNGDGSIDGSGSAFALGDLAFTSPADGATVSGNFVASWSDTGSAAGGTSYAPFYYATISGTSDYAVYAGTDRQFTVSSLLNPGAPLTPGSYSASVTGFSGGFGGSGGSFTVTNNITGAGVTGIFYSSSSTTGTVSFTMQ